MFVELIAVFVAGFAGAGVMMLLGKLSGNRLPRWLIPVGAGAAMLAAAISSEMSWYSRTASALPEGLEVAQTGTETAFWRPWTYIWPMTDRFVAVDTENLRENSETASLYMADLYFFGRWKPTQAVEIMVDCDGMRRADPGLGDDSPPVWRDVGDEDALVQTVCNSASGA